MPTGATRRAGRRTPSDYFDRQQRDRRGRSFEARITSKKQRRRMGCTWVAGVYGLDVNEQL